MSVVCTNRRFQAQPHGLVYLFLVMEYLKRTIIQYYVCNAAVQVWKYGLTYRLFSDPLLEIGIDRHVEPLNSGVVSGADVD